MNLQMLLRDVFDSSVAAMAAHVEMSPERLRSLLNDSISSEMAEHLEQVLGLPGGWLDNKRSSLDARHLRKVILGESDDEQDAAQEIAGEATVSETVKAASAQQMSRHETQQPLANEGPQDVFAVAADANADTSADQVQQVTQQAAQPDIDQRAAETDAKNASIEASDGMALPQQEPAQPTQMMQPEQRPAAPTAPLQDDEFKIREALLWANLAIDKMPSKIRSTIRQILRSRLHRSQSTLSTWLNGSRRPPEDAMIQLTREFLFMDLHFAKEFAEKMFQAAPCVFSESVQKALRNIQPNEEIIRILELSKMSVDYVDDSSELILQRFGSSQGFATTGHRESDRSDDN